MQWSNVKLIFRRELRDQLRDRRTLFTIAVMPLVLYPLLGMTFLQIAQFMRKHETPVRLIGADYLPADPPLLEGGQFGSTYTTDAESDLIRLQVEPRPPADFDAEALRAAIEADLQRGEVDAVVLFPEDFASKLRAHRLADDGQQVGLLPQPQIFVNTASDKSRIAYDRLDRVLKRWRQAIVKQNLAERKISVAATEPFQLQDIDVAADETRRAAVWSKVLPFVVLVWALTGAFYPAIDLCAGEKERGTLETLLCSPAERSEIVWGKLLTIMFFSMATSILNLASMGMTGTFIIRQLATMGPSTAGQMGAPPLFAMGWLVLALIPISALFSALSLAIAAFARSSKEGQYYLLPLLLITMPLLLLPMLPAAELGLGTALIPVTGVMLLLRSLVEGQYVEALVYLPPVTAVTVVCCLLAIRWAIDQFNNESVLFRASERWSVQAWLRHLIRDRGATPKLGHAAACGVFLLLIRFFAGFAAGAPESWSDFAVLQSVSLVLLIAGPPLLMSLLLTRSPRETLLLRLPRAGSVALAVLLALAIHPLAMGLAGVVSTLYPLGDDIAAQLAGVESLLLGASFWQLLVVMAVLPAVCEEIAFRGFILSGLRHMGHKWAAIAISSLLFGLTHGILQQSIITAVVGLVIGYLAIQTRSLLVPIVFHVVFNSLSLFLQFGMADWVAEVPALEAWFVVQQGKCGYQWTALAVGGIACLALLGRFHRLPFLPSAEERLQEALDHQTARPMVTLK